MSEKITEFLDKIDNKLSRMTSIVDKLDYWCEIKEKDVDEPTKLVESRSVNEQSEYERNYLRKLLGEDYYKRWTELKIPNQLYHKHFKNESNNPEYSYWFLKYNAKIEFDVKLEMNYFNEKLKSNLAKDFIEAELKRLYDEEDKAKKLIENKSMEIYHRYSIPDPEHHKDLELVRVLADYYKSNRFEPFNVVNGTTVSLYADHINLKQFLEIKLEELENKPPEKQTDKETPLTWRQRALINKFRIDASEMEQYLNQYPDGWRKHFPKNFEKSIDSVNEYSKAYKTITRKEVEAILPKLSNFPKVKKAAEKYLEELS